jgi:hypothetical protein
MLIQKQQHDIVNFETELHIEPTNMSRLSIYQ